MHQKSLFLKDYKLEIKSQKTISLLWTHDKIKYNSNEYYQTKTYKYFENKSLTLSNNFIIIIVNREIYQIQLDNR